MPIINLDKVSKETTRLRNQYNDDEIKLIIEDLEWYIKGEP